MENKKWLIDADEFKMFLEDVRQDYLEEDTFSSDFAAKVIETVQDEYLTNAPTVDAVEVVHGRWEEQYTPNGKYVAWDGFYCSICGKQSAKSNYCPNCGAKMDGDKNETA